MTIKESTQMSDLKNYFMTHGNMDRQKKLKKKNKRHNIQVSLIKKL